MPANAAAFTSAGLKFLRDLASHNTTAWFQAHRDEYKQLVREPMLAIVEAVNAELAGFAPRYRAELPRAVSRPNRDTRFSADKSPYKTEISAVFPCDGMEKHLAAGFFFRIAPGGAQVIGGSVVPGPDETRKIRSFIAKEHRRLDRALNGSSLRSLFGALQGEQLKNVPKPFATDHAAADLLRHKQFYLEATLPASAIPSPKFAEEVARRFRIMLPVVELLDEALGNGRKR